MKLVSIFNVWADTLCLLPYAIKNHLEFSDAVIVVWSMQSNIGVWDESVYQFSKSYPQDPRVIFFQQEPQMAHVNADNEILKRNSGIEQAKIHGATHFLIADGDEFYRPNEVNEAKLLFNDHHLKGLVCNLHVFVGKPTLWCEDHTRVTFIQKLYPNTQVGSFPSFPHAYEDGHARIDPTRRVNVTEGVLMCGVIMDHMSYVRKNIELKIDNSTANLRRSYKNIIEDMTNAKPGYMSKLYHRELKECQNYFNLPIW